ncbi:LLM class flavin-dependent oxidoreductase [Nocardia sp. NPDC051570]|uniref:LLM class flavin-dependent oxidoreductase n=1 Tax=Nocardia sp. NPDC051570 TaxID=3364324 RepID=UPI0037A175D5
MISVPLSALDLAIVQKGTSAHDALHAAVTVAGHLERLGYHRMWSAEHHGNRAFASCSPPVIIGQILARTSTLRVGSGGVMLPNQAPLVVAEQFATLDAFHPGRIDLGMGRGPGTRNAEIARTLRRGADPATDEEYQRDVHAVLSLFDEDADPPVLPNYHASLERWLLSSSTTGARLAGELGLPLAIAHHLRPHNTLEALAAYRKAFRPSPWLSEPYVLLCVRTICADTDDRADHLAGPSDIGAVHLEEGKPVEFLAPEEAAAYRYSAAQEQILQRQRQSRAQGSPDTVTRQLTDLLEITAADELMLYTPVYDLADRLRSYELVASRLASIPSRLLPELQQ